MMIRDVKMTISTIRPRVDFARELLCHTVGAVGASSLEVVLNNSKALVSTVPTKNHRF